MSDHLPTQTLREFEAMGATARDAALAHMEGCAACRKLWLAHDPVRAFALLSRAPIPETALDRLSGRIAAAVDSLDPRSRFAGRRWFGAAAVAASMLLAALVGALLWTHEMPEEQVARIDEIGFLQPLVDEVAEMRLVAIPGDQAQVFDLTIGETQVLMIFDESIEL